MSRDDGAVVDILAAVRRVQQFLIGVSSDAFVEDIEKQSAVLDQFAVIGEAVRRVLPEYRRCFALLPLAGPGAWVCPPA